MYGEVGWICVIYFSDSLGQFFGLFKSDVIHSKCYFIVCNFTIK